MGINLYELIKKYNFRGFSLTLLQRFARQNLGSLVFLRRHRIIHCDLKPENILLRQAGRSTLKLIDFGSSCFANQRIYTYIQSRFYRAPEIMLAIPYTEAIDMWSFGCILAELRTGFPLFPGDSEPEQMALIMELIGLPPPISLQVSSLQLIDKACHSQGCVLRLRRPSPPQHLVCEPSSSPREQDSRGDFRRYRPPVPPLP